MMKKFCVLIVAAMAIATPDMVRSDVVGDTYSFGLAGFDYSAAGTLLMPIATTTFDGTSKNVGSSSFGNSGDVMILSESSEVYGAQIQVEMSILAYNAAGGLTNWFADGSISSGGSPFNRAGFYLAWSVGEDRLDPLFSGTSASNYIIDSATYLWVGTNGTLFGDGGGVPFPFFDFSDATGLGGAAIMLDVRTNNSDLSSFTRDGEELAGMQINFAITTVPEPTGLMLVALTGVSFLRRSRT